MNQPAQPKSDLPKRNPTLQALGGLLIFLMTSVMFTKLAGEVAEKEHVLFDVAFLHWIHSFNSPVLDSTFLFFTLLGNALFIISALLLIAGYLAYKKYFAHAFLLLFGVGGATVINLILKVIFQRDRPALWQTLVTETSYSFPSGHAMISSAFVLCLVIMLWNTRWRSWAIGIGGFFIVMIGLSRLYLGVHYPSDVLAGWAAGTAWTAVSIWVSRLGIRLQRNH